MQKRSGRQLRIVMLITALSVHTSLYVNSWAQDIHKCGDVFTNKPCGAVESQPATTTESDAARMKRKEEAVVRSKKEVLLHDLRFRALKAKKELGVSTDLADVTDVCQDPSSTVSACRAAVIRVDSLLEDRSLGARMAKSAEAQATSAAKSAKQVPAQVNNQVVVVQPQWFPTPTPRFVFDNGGIYPPFDPSRPNLPPLGGQQPQVGLPGYQLPRLPDQHGRPAFPR